MAEKILIKIEDGFTPIAQEVMTNSGDNKTFAAPSLGHFSLSAEDENGINRTPDVRPDGVRSGFLISPALSGTNDLIDVKGGKIFQSFNKITVAGVTDLAVARPATLPFITHSITINSAGAIVVVAGTEGAAFSSVRGAVGAAPFIPVGSIEIGLVNLTAIATAPITSDEIVFSPEWSHTPSYKLLPYTASVEFMTALATIHTGNVTRSVYVKYSKPILVDISAPLSKIKPVKLPQKIASQLFFSGTRSKVVEGELSEGSFEYEVPAGIGHVLNRIDNSTRLITIMPDSTADRRLLFYALVTNEEEFVSGEITLGTATLSGIQAPIEEVV